jgi:hypothetical protein
LSGSEANCCTATTLDIRFLEQKYIKWNLPKKFHAFCSNIINLASLSLQTATVAAWAWDKELLKKKLPTLTLKDIQVMIYKKESHGLAALLPKCAMTQLSLLACCATACERACDQISNKQSPVSGTVCQHNYTTLAFGPPLFFV